MVLRVGIEHNVSSLKSTFGATPANLFTQLSNSKYTHYHLGGVLLMTVSTNRPPTTGV